jgi:hypothetical protein
MLTAAVKLGMLPGLLAVFAAVLAEGTALFDLTLAAGVRALERVDHGSPRGQLYASISATARSIATLRSDQKTSVLSQATSQTRTLANHEDTKHEDVLYKKSFVAFVPSC